MRTRQYALIAALAFTLVALLQLARAYYGWPVVVGSAEIPVAVSWVAGAVAALLAVVGFMTARQYPTAAYEESVAADQLFSQKRPPRGAQQNLSGSERRRDTR